MHICLATREFPPITDGGIATYYVHLAKLLAGDGHKVTVLTVGKEGEQSQWTYPDIKVITLSDTCEKYFRQLKRRFDPEMHSTAHAIADGLAMRDWLRHHRESCNFDVIETAEFSGYGAFLLEHDLPPVLTTCHGSVGQVCHHEGGHKLHKRRILIGLEVVLLGLADAVVANSPMNAVEWSAYLGRDIRYVIMPWIKPTEHERNERLKALQSNQTINGLVVGRLQIWKGVIETVEALRICGERNVKVHLRWVGRDTLTSPEGGSMAKHLEHHYPDILGHNFEWIEYLDREQTIKAQAQADFALIPSRWDTFNYTTIEAMSVSTPVIVSSGAGSSYLIRHNETGLIITPGDPTSVANAIEQMVLSSDLRMRLGEAGYATIQREFDPEKIVEDRINAYDRAINQRIRRRSNPYLSSAVGALIDALLSNRTTTFNSLISCVDKLDRKLRAYSQVF